MQFRHVKKPFAHQAKELELSWNQRQRGLFWEMGTGKTKPVIDTAAALWEAKSINGLLVFAPNGAHRNWESDELPAHMPPDVLAAGRTLCWSTGKAGTKAAQNEAAELLRTKGGLPIALMSYDSLMTDLGAKFVKRFLKDYDCLLVADESQMIKTPGAKRTIRTLACSKNAPFRRVMSGTPASTPFDFYSQIKFLGDRAWDEIGCGNFLAFKNTFGVFEEAEVRAPGGRLIKFNQTVGYKNLEMLARIVAQHASRLLKEDVLDLPPKLYSKRYCELTPEQRKAYNDLKVEYLTMVDGNMLTAPLAITRMLRFQQITSGYLPADSDATLRPLGTTNPRLRCLEDVLEDSRGVPKIVWAKYKEDHRLIEQLLKEMKISYVRYDGTISDDQRLKNKERFQKTGDVETFLANPAVGGTSLTITRARAEIFYNTTFNLLDRLQAEDRAHRIGQEHPVAITDIVARGTVDEYILKTLRQGRDLVSVVLGDNPRDWL